MSYYLSLVANTLKNKKEFELELNKNIEKIEKIQMLKFQLGIGYFLVLSFLLIKLFV